MGSINPLLAKSLRIHREIDEELRKLRALIAPERISMSAFIDSIDRKGNSFGGDVGVTLSVDRSEVAQILAATTSGRIVIVSSHG